MRLFRVFLEHPSYVIFVTSRIRKTANLLNFMNLDVLLRFLKDAFTEKSPVILKIGLFVISLSNNVLFMTS